MIIKKLDRQSPKAKIWDNEKNKVLFTFVNVEFQTDDDYIIECWSKQFDKSINVLTNKHDPTEKPTKKRGRPKK